ncbi:MAG: hypothetical protein C0481_02335 [Phenylobacterium sp.]|nr:hypothetical protein [Phenylobacterium sp.]
MLRIGYPSKDDQNPEAIAALMHAGCNVVRCEDLDVGAPRARLEAILSFMAPDDRLVVRRLGALGGPRATLQLLDRLNACEAILEVLEPPFSSQGPAGDALRAALGLSPDAPAEKPLRRTRPDAIRDLRRIGRTPTEIAKQLGVSRMTVWRALKSAN